MAIESKLATYFSVCARGSWFAAESELLTQFHRLHFVQFPFILHRRSTTSISMDFEVDSTELFRNVMASSDIVMSIF